MINYLYKIICLINCHNILIFSSISVHDLKIMDHSKYEDIVNRYGQENIPKTLYFNKGLWSQSK